MGNRTFVRPPRFPQRRELTRADLDRFGQSIESVARLANGEQPLPTGQADTNQFDSPTATAVLIEAPTVTETINVLGATSGSATGTFEDATYAYLVWDIPGSAFGLPGTIRLKLPLPPQAT